MLGELCEYRVARSHVADMLAHLAWENRDFSLRVVDQLLTLVNEADFNKLKRYGRPLVRLL